MIGFLGSVNLLLMTASVSVYIGSTQLITSLRYQYKKLPMLLDWGFDLVDKKIPLNRVKVLETTFERINKSYRK